VGPLYTVSVIVTVRTPASLSAGSAHGDLCRRVSERLRARPLVELAALLAVQGLTFGGIYHGAERNPGPGDEWETTYDLVLGLSTES
jgi:hypothetical protein